MSNEEKKIYTRDEFDDMRREYAQKMACDTDLMTKALDLKVQAGHDYYYVHQTNWMGEPCLQLTDDLFALQECIYKSKPDYIVECGVCWGGGTIFLATALSAVGGKGVIGIDIFMPDNVKQKIREKSPSDIEIELIEASSIDPATASKVKALTKNTKTMVILDSHHTHDHVLSELELYAPLVKQGNYLVCGDTSIERQPPAPLRPRPWGKGNNPATALKEYLSKDSRFQVDAEIENKLLMSNNPGGYLLCTND
jgi:cephalosporin hydroxylase